MKAKRILMFFTPLLLATLVTFPAVAGTSIEDAQDFMDGMKADILTSAQWLDEIDIEFDYMWDAIEEAILLSGPGIDQDFIGALSEIEFAKEEKHRIIEWKIQTICGYLSTRYNVALRYLDLEAAFLELEYALGFDPKELCPDWGLLPEDAGIKNFTENPDADPEGFLKLIADLEANGSISSREAARIDLYIHSIKKVLDQVTIELMDIGLFLEDGDVDEPQTPSAEAADDLDDIYDLAIWEILDGAAGDDGTPWLGTLNQAQSMLRLAMIRKERIYGKLRWVERYFDSIDRRLDRANRGSTPYGGRSRHWFRRRWWLGEPITPVPIAITKAFAVNKIALSHGSEGMLDFKIEGTGIESAKVQIYDLGGRLILNREGYGNSLRFQAMDSNSNLLANGVYLYVVTVRGGDGSVYTSEVRKLVILR